MILLSVEIINNYHIMMTKMHDLIKLFCRFFNNKYNKINNLQKFNQDDFTEFVEYYNEDLTFLIMFSLIARDVI